MQVMCGLFIVQAIASKLIVAQGGRGHTPFCTTYTHPHLPSHGVSMVGTGGPARAGRRGSTLFCADPALSLVARLPGKCRSSHPSTSRSLQPFGPSFLCCFGLCEVHSVGAYSFEAWGWDVTGDS
jgi:hypothetical protein